VTGRLRSGRFATACLTAFNAGTPVAAAVGDKEILLLWQPEDSPEVRSFEKLIAGAFHPEGMVREASPSGRDILAQIMLMSPRLASIGWLTDQLQRYGVRGRCATGAGQPWGRREPPSSGRTSLFSLFDLFVRRLFDHSLSLNY